MENSGNFYNPNDPNIKCNAIWSNWGTTVTHQTINGKYRLSIKRADTKGIDGFTAEVCGDDLEEVETEARKLYDYAIGLTKPDSKIGEEVKA